MIKLKFYKQVKKDYKKALKRGCKKEKIEEVIKLLQKQQPLPDKYRDHFLVNFQGKNGVRECHIQPDWLLIYEIDDENLILGLLRTGSHSELF